MQFRVLPLLIFFVFLSCFCQHIVAQFVSLNKCPSSSLLNEIEFPASIMADQAATLFRLDHGKWVCIQEQIKIKFHPKALNETSIDETIIEPNHNIRVFSDGFLEIKKEESREYFSPSEYCLESLDKSQITVQICKVKCGGKVTCVPKCCFWEEGLTPEEIGCVPRNQKEWSPIVAYGQNQKNCSSSGKSSKGCADIESWKKQDLHYRFVELSCDDPHNYPSDRTPFQLLMNGSILISNSIVISSGFCVDGLINDNGDLTSQMLLTCPVQETATEIEDRHLTEYFSTIYSVIMFISSFFLFLTALVYVLIWDKHNLHGYTVFSHSVSMFFMLVFLAISHTMSKFLYHDSARTWTCIGIGLLSHYFFLTTFCWLTMLNFDLWWTFKTLSPTIAKSKGLQRFVFYSLFAWGVPTGFVSIAFILDQTYTNSTTWIPLAQYGVNKCYINNKAEGIYLYLPIGLLLGLNIIFFGSTIYIMYKYQQSTKSARQRNTNGQSQSFKLFAKLFLIMGVTWIFEVISWCFTSEKKVSIAWIFFDFINLFQGIAIFIIFVCKRQVLSHLWNKYPSLRCFLSPLTRLSCCKLTGMDIGGREGSSGVRTTQSNISMKNFSRANSISES